MPVTLRCPRCGKSLRVPGEAVGRRVRCASCGLDFEMTDPNESSGAFSGENPVARPETTRDETLSRSMLPVRVSGVVPADEMLGRVEPGTLRWLNATSAVEEFLGQSLEELRRRNFTEFLHPDDRALAEDEFRKAVEIGERHDFVLRIPDAAARIRYVRVYTQARYNPDGSINHIRCYLKDVTARVQAEEELRRRTEQLTAANEQLRQINQKLKEAQGQLVHTEKLAALGTLAAGMAHEINNPLAYAMNNVSVIEREVGDLLRLIACFHEGWPAFRAARPDLADTIEALEAQADFPYVRENLPRMAEATRQGLQRVAKIVENLRGFAQVDRSEVSVIDVNTSVDQSLAMLADALSQNQVKVDRHFDRLPPLECAAGAMNQVFLNLLLNALQAIQATGRGSGSIRLETRWDAGEVVVEVSDNGTGIPAEDLPRIFDPFFTTKPVGRGTGLGLSVSHGIVADHGGRIEVESAPGAGSTFRIRLPTERPGAKTAAH